MEQLTLEQVNNMDAESMRQVLRNAVIERQRAEQAEADRRKAEEEAKAKEEEWMNNFFAGKMKNQSPRFGDQY